MTLPEKPLSIVMFPGFGYACDKKLHIRTMQTGITAKAYDPELIYVECQRCGKPVIWDPGKTTKLLHAAGVDLYTIDPYCLILSDGCPNCQPEEQEGFTLTIVRIAGTSPEELLFISRAGGKA